MSTDVALRLLMQPGFNWKNSEGSMNGNRATTFLLTLQSHAELSAFKNRQDNVYQKKFFVSLQAINNGVTASGSFIVTVMWL